MLRSLAHNGILHATRGPYGGYAFTRDRNGVTLSDILHAVGIGGSGAILESEILTKIVLPALSPAEQALKQALDQINLNDLARFAKAIEIGLSKGTGREAKRPVKAGQS